MEESVCIINDLGNKYVLELRYDNFIKYPIKTIKEFLDFIELKPDNNIFEYAQSKLHSKSINKPDPMPELTQLLASDSLNILGYH